MTPNISSTPLYGINQFQEKPASNGFNQYRHESSRKDMNDLSRSRSAAAIITNSNSSGIYHAMPYNLDLVEESKCTARTSNDGTSPPPRPPLPQNYESPYFLSLPRDWHELTRSSSYSAMLC